MRPNVRKNVVINTIFAEDLIHYATAVTHACPIRGSCPSSDVPLLLSTSPLPSVFGPSEKRTR